MADISRSFADGIRDEGLAQGNTPAADWDQNSAKRALDELFSLTFQYRSSKAYQELLKFVARFRTYSPFNAMLVHIQMPGAEFVAPPSRWRRAYGRAIKPGARPLVILQPMGPVMFVFDVSSTESAVDGTPLPPEVERPFEVSGGRIGGELELLVTNAKRDGVRVAWSPDGSQSAASIRPVANGVAASQECHAGTDQHGNPILVHIPVKYDLVVNSIHSREAQFASVAHELAHLYCGHLGTPNDRWWPDRRGLKHKIMEFEAESIAYMVCARSGIENPSEKYLAGYCASVTDVPPISLECVMKGAGLIETMGRLKLKPRKRSNAETGV